THNGRRVVTPTIHNPTSSFTGGSCCIPNDAAFATDHATGNGPPFPVSRFPLYIRRRTLRGDPMGIGAQPSAPAEPNSFLSDVLDVFNVLHEPDAVFTRVKERPRILAPWIVFSLAFIVISILTQPYQQAAMEAFKATL